MRFAVAAAFRRGFRDISQLFVAMRYSSRAFLVRGGAERNKKRKFKVCDTRGRSRLGTETPIAHV